jgi:hypothetical protein
LPQREFVLANEGAWNHLRAPSLSVSIFQGPLRMRDQANFGYQISKHGDGWRWVTFDLSGAVRQRGEAPTKAIAAACIVRALARVATEVDLQRAA